MFESLIFLVLVFFSSIFSTEIRDQHLLPCTQEQTPLIDPPRAEPLRELSTSSLIKVSDFGAIPDDGIEDTAAIQKAIDHAVTLQSPTKIAFNSGVYDVKPSDDQAALVIQRANGLVIEGNGTLLLVHNPKSGLLKIANSKRIIVSGLAVDYSPLPFTQSTVTGVNYFTNQITVKIQEGFPRPDAPHFQSSKTWGDGNTKGLLKDPAVPTALKPDTPNSFIVKNVKRLDAKRYKFDLGFLQARYFQKGDPFVYLARGGPGVFTANQSEDITFKNLIIYSGPGAAFLAGGSQRINLLGNEVVPAPGRWQSVDADGIILYRNRIGPWIEGNTFQSTGDDSVNINTPAAVIADTSDGIVLRGRVNHLGQRQPIDVQAQDLYRLYNPHDGSLLGQRIVKRAAKVNPYEFVVEWDHPLPASILLESQGERATIFYNENTSGQGYVIRDSQFLHSRRYGVLLQAPHGVVTNNLFSRTSGNAILLMNTIHSGSGFVPYNITIENNCIIDAYTQKVVNRGKNHGAAIASTIEKLDYRRGTFQGIRNVKIQGNTILNWHNAPAIWMQNTQGLVIDENEFIVSPSAKPFLFTKQPAIAVEYGADLDLGENRIEDHRQSLEDSIHIDL